MLIIKKALSSAKKGDGEMKKRVAGLALAMGLMATASMVQAGTSYSGYDIILPRGNEVNYTPQQTKAATNVSADLKVTILGKANDARAYSPSGGTGPWVRIASLTSGTKLPNTIDKGDATRVQFSSDLTTLVDSRVKGEWRSN